LHEHAATSLPGKETSRRQAAFVAGYFALYLAYLFVNPEGEFLHWLTLVLLPLIALATIGPDRHPRSLLRSIGLDSSRTTQGLGLTLLLGAAFQVLQFLNVRQRDEFLTLLDQPLGFLLPVGGLLLLLGTVATTEEVFFRGIMQNRLAAVWRSQWLALVVTTVAFALYHVPYAYLKPSWPSAGDLPAAMQLAATNGVIGGLALGVVYWRSNGNLVAAIVLHALIDLIPATRLLVRLVERLG
jgi:membrane protease YdiL (CAAX protease family)